MAQPGSTPRLQGTDLILDATVASVPIELLWSSDTQGWSLAGRVRVDASLGDLPGAGTRHLQALAGLPADESLAGLRFQELGLRLRQATHTTLELMADLEIGRNRCRISLLDLPDHPGAWAVGLRLQAADTETSGRNLLSGLIGEIRIRELGFSYANKLPPGLVVDLGAPLDDASMLSPAPSQSAPMTLQPGFKFVADVDIGGSPLLDAAQPPETPPVGPAQGSAPPSTGPSKGGSVAWFKLGKSLGPLTVNRVGLGFEAGQLGIKLDAGLKLGALTLKLQGLGVSYPLSSLFGRPKNIWSHLQFHLDGAGVAFEGGPVHVSGALTRVASADGLQLDGVLVIGTPALTVSAIASYADLNGQPSFFAFAALHKELGGPPFFFVTGLAVGMGIHRRLQLPPIEAVDQFPLLRAALDPDYPLAGKDQQAGSALAAMSAALTAHIAPSHGDMWIAAGVRFRSFGMIETVALLSVAFGTRTEIGLLGLSRIQVPPRAPGENASPVIVYAELALKAALDPEQGLLSVEARLTESSYILRKEFKLRGGFAFYSWFGGEHRGDFVISLGGYHPRYQPPAHYPRPDRVSFSSRVGDVAISGSCYFALCPAAIMAGGRLSIVYESGCVRAWLDACADLLLQWKPVHYDVAIAVSVGVAVNVKVWFVRVRISVELSATITLYGPPLGGAVRVSLWVVSFTVRFGEANTPPPPLTWEAEQPERSFARAFLPGPEVTRITIAKGLRQETPAVPSAQQPALCIVDAQSLVIEFSSEVPATRICLGDEPVSTDPPRQPPGVRPMNLAAIDSLIEITLKHCDGGSETDVSRALRWVPQTRNLPQALWGPPVAQGRTALPLAHEQLIEGALVGLALRAPEARVLRPGPVLSLAALAIDERTIPATAVRATPTRDPGVRGNVNLSDTLRKAAVTDTRREILRQLRRRGLFLPSDDELSVSVLAEAPDCLFQAMPTMAAVGVQPR